MQLTVRQSVISKDELISRVGDLAIYEYYIAGIALKKNICSPLRKDRNPSWGIYIHENRVMWKDWATDEAGDSITMVQRMYNLKSYKEAIQKIAEDLGIADKSKEYKRIIYDQPETIENKHSIIQVSTRKMEERDYQYWNQFLIGKKELEQERVYAVQELYINRRKEQIKAKERVYAYHYPDVGFKIYMVDRPKGEKWKSNIPCSYVENVDNLNSDARVLITKSKKDRICMSALVPYIVLNMQNEGKSGFTEEFRKKLEGREVIINYDADDPGVRNCKAICDKWSYKYLNTPRHLLERGIKDISDWIKADGIEPVKEFMQLKGII